MFQTRKKHLLYIWTLAFSFWDGLHTWVIATSYPLPSCPLLLPTASSPLLLQSYFFVTHQGNWWPLWTWQLQIPQDSKEDSREQTNYFVLHNSPPVPRRATERCATTGLSWDPHTTPAPSRNWRENQFTENQMQEFAKMPQCHALC